MWSFQISQYYLIFVGINSAIVNYIDSREIVPDACSTLPPIRMQVRVPVGKEYGRTIRFRTAALAPAAAAARAALLSPEIAVSSFPLTEAW